MRGSARSDAQSDTQPPQRVESTASGHDLADTTASTAHREGSSGLDQTSRKPTPRGGPWKGLAAIFRRKPAPSPLATAAAASTLRTDLEHLQQPQESQPRNRQRVKTRAPEDADASTQPSMCSTPPSPFADDAAAQSSSSTPRSADANAAGQWPGDGERTARCTGCGAPLSQAPLLSSLNTRDGGLATVLAGPRRSSSATSDSPSLREWSGPGSAQLCSECSRRAAAARYQRACVPWSACVLSSLLSAAASLQPYYCKASSVWYCARLQSAASAWLRVIPTVWGCSARGFTQ